jgi:hypothetical protein
MSTLLITYDLKKPGQDYSSFYDVIKKYAWAKLSESSYAIQTYESPVAIYNQLAAHMDKNDQVYIVTLNAPWYGFGPEKVNEWLAKALSRLQV